MDERMNKGFKDIKDHVDELDRQFRQEKQARQDREASQAREASQENLARQEKEQAQVEGEAIATLAQRIEDIQSTLVTLVPMATMVATVKEEVESTIKALLVSPPSEVPNLTASQVTIAAIPGIPNIPGIAAIPEIQASVLSLDLQAIQEGLSSTIDDDIIIEERKSTRKPTKRAAKRT